MIGRAGVVVLWSVCSPSTPTITVRIHLKSQVFFRKLLEKIKNEQKEAGDGPFLRLSILANLAIKILFYFNKPISERHLNAAPKEAAPER